MSDVETTTEQVADKEPKSAYQVIREALEDYSRPEEDLADTIIDHLRRNGYPLDEPARKGAE